MITQFVALIVHELSNPLFSLPTNDSTIFSFIYLILAFEPIDLPVTSVQAGRKQITRNPLVSVMPPLSCHFGYSHWSREIELNPLVVIVVPCAPGSHVTTMPNSAQSPKPGCVMFVVFRRYSNLGIRKPTIL